MLHALRPNDDDNTEQVRPPFVPPLAPGTRLGMGRYVVLEPAGSGGQGRVYKVLDAQLRAQGIDDVIRAVKEMVPAAPEMRDKFPSLLEEAKLLITLDHTGIPTMYDLFTEQGRLYIVLKYIEGDNLEEVLAKRSGKLTEDVVGEWMMQLCDIVHFLHSRKPSVIFRDLKPSNVMLTPGGNIVLVDFGIARVLEEGLPSTGVGMGTRGFAPPEQYRGKAEPRSDIYAMGAMMHYLLTGSDPRRFDPFTFHERPPRSLNPDVSPGMEALILRCVEYRMEDRYQTIYDLREALQGTLGITLALRTPYQISSPKPREPRSSASSSQQVPGVMPRKSPKLLWRYQTREQVRGGAAAAYGMLLVGSYDAQLHAIDLSTGAARWTYRTGGGICGTPVVWHDRVIVGSEDRNVYAVSLQGGRELWRFGTDGPVRSSPRIFDDRLYIGSDDTHEYALDPESGQMVWRFRTYGVVRSAATYAHGLVIVGSADAHLYGLDPAAQVDRWSKSTGGKIFSSPVAYEGHVYVGSMDSALYCMSAKSGWLTWHEWTHDSVISSPCVVDDRVYVGSTDGFLYCFNRWTGKRYWWYPTGDQIVSSPVHADGVIYFGSANGAIFAVDVASGKQVWRFETSGVVAATPLVHNGVVYCGSADGCVYALAAQA